MSHVAERSTTVLPGLEARRDAAFSTAAASVLVVYALLACFKLGVSDLGVDEGRFGISAINILTDHRQIATVSEQPLGGPGWKPYLYPLVLAASLGVAGHSETALRFVNVAAVALSALCLYHVARAFLPPAGAMLAAAFLLLNPASIRYARTVMPEPWVLLPGCVALLSAYRFWRRPRWLTAAITGAALGLGFLAKLWLVFPFALACAVLFLARLSDRPRTPVVGGAIVGVVAFLLVASSHVALALVLAPETAAHWARVYVVHYFTSRVSGEAYDPAMWFRPWWFYLATLFKVAAVGLPFVLLGAARVARTRSLPIGGVLLCLLSPVLLFAVFRVKQASYIVAAFPAVALLFALGMLQVWNSDRRAGVQVATAVSMLLAASMFVVGGLGAAEAVALLVLYAMQALIVFTPRSAVQLRRGGLVAVVFLALVAGDVLVVRQLLDFRTHYREIAAYFKDRLAASQPADRVFTAPEYPSLEFYAFRTGEYWETFYFKKDEATYLDELTRGLRAFYIVDPSGRLYGSRMSVAKLNALETLAVDVTSDIERVTGARLAVRAFVPRGR
jgi:4-amino-4-deoxy-L-arabinose transferase-like glycosyltransferase